MRKSSPKEQGQALVLVLLTLAVILTLVLYVLARTVTDVAVSSRQEEAVRAFSAAEAGVEKALIVGSIGDTAIGDASYTANVSDYASGAHSFYFPNSLGSGESVTLWFVSHDKDGNATCSGAYCYTGQTLKVCWGNPGTPGNNASTPAIELSVFYETTANDPATARIARTAIDPYGLRRDTGVGGDAMNKFAAPAAGTCTIGGKTFAFQKTINYGTDLGIPASSYNTAGGLRFAKLRMFYPATGHFVGFDVGASAILPSQGTLVDSSGTAGESHRRISVFQGWPEPPAVFDYAIYSSTGLVK